MCSLYARRQLHHVTRKYQQLGSGDGSDADAGDYCLFVVRQNRRLFMDYVSLPVPDDLQSSPEAKRIWDLIQVKQPGSTAVAAQIQAILSYSPSVTEKLKDYPVYGERLLELTDFIDGCQPSSVCHV